jgi:hypothetical protein
MNIVLVGQKGVARKAEEAPYSVSVAIIQTSLIGIAINVSVSSYALPLEANIWR